MRLTLLVILTIIFSSYYSQNENYYLQSLEKPKLKKRVKNIYSISTVINDTLDEDDFFLKYETKYTGWYHEFILNDTNISIAVNKEEVYGYYKEISDVDEYSYSYHPIHIRDCGSDGYGYTRKVNLDDITVLHSKNKLKPYAKAGAWTSLFTAAIISPLASYNFKSKTINSQSYNTWIISSLSATTFFTTFTIILKDKDYRIKSYLCNNAEWKLIRK